jgi:ureidoacrylate peracid hydrolase
LGRAPGAVDAARLGAQLSPGRVALIVVDMQNDYVHPRGRVGRSGGPDYEQATAEINRLVALARAAAVPVVYTLTEHGPGLDLPAYEPMRAKRRPTDDEGVCVAGTWGAALIDGINPPGDADQIVVKHGYDAMAVAELPARLHAAGIDTVVVTGVATNVCVAATIAGAYERGFLVVVPREATMASNPAARQASLRHIDRYYGDVVPVGVVADSWSS